MPPVSALELDTNCAVLFDLDWNGMFPTAGRLEHADQLPSCGERRRLRDPICDSADLQQCSQSPAPFLALQLLGVESTDQVSWLQEWATLLFCGRS